MRCLSVWEGVGRRGREVGVRQANEGKTVEELCLDGSQDVENGQRLGCESEQEPQEFSL